MIRRSWLLAINAVVTAVLIGGVLAPLLAFVGLHSAAQAVYGVYSLTCHQWAFRSFFLFGQQVVYAREQLALLGVDPFRFAGDASLGWKMAFCERDLAIYLGVLAAGIWYARRRDQPGLSLWAYALLIVPMGLDGGTQLFGWRESTWELRVATGLVFGVASVWLLYPRLDAFLHGERAGLDYAAGNACAPQPPRG